MSRNKKISLDLKNKEKRLERYLGNLRLIDYMEVKDPNEKLIVTHKREGFEEWYNIYPKEKVYLFEDTNIPVSYPVITTLRPIKNIGYNVLLPFDDAEPLEDDNKFEDKKDDLIWRGSNSGGDKRVGIELWHKMFDLGFTNIKSKSYKGTRNVDELDALKKDHIPIRDQLKYKYILALEGKGPPKNLKQILASNSLCLMPKLTMESWFLEGELLPWVHYLPVEDSLCDLELKMIWIRKRPKVAKRIIGNANRFVKEFQMVNNRELTRDILIQFSEKIDIAYNKDETIR